jgi:hypothetical protein
MKRLSLMKPSEFSPSPEDVALFYAECKRLRGKAETEEFGRNLQAFFDFTYDAYIYGEGSRSRAFNNFANYLVNPDNRGQGHHNPKEAALYFECVDNVHPYSRSPVTGIG